jgi:hypothetical protein
VLGVPTRSLRIRIVTIRAYSCRPRAALRAATISYWLVLLSRRQSSLRVQWKLKLGDLLPLAEAKALVCFYVARCYYRSSLTFVPRGFSSTSLEKGMHRPPAFSTLTSARGENLKAAMVSFSFGSPEPRTLPGTAMTSPPLRFLETWPRLRTILVLRDLPRKLATVIQRGV